ncbi:general transcription factor 3C polypeptide 1-like isoform X2 [Penaeus chinensis]|uniref:general transcription factor 3C polypeptide 1-like isoform X2 n=1 Tax=Penaeus chinensis TaxID=139456 RepID=UPI001FB6FC8A|nr:general transcription factor 3C polypeptide 1-like isoform X2 [Penaeus chinensis]
MSCQGLQYIVDLEDEIALEGLDGITLEALWTRLKQRPNFEGNMPIDSDSKAFLWSLIVQDEEISLFQLPTPREKLEIFNRYEHMDPELGIVLEPEEEPKDIYPFHPVEDDSEGVRGSCKMFHERVNVSDSASLLTLAEVEKEYGEKLVLVASQMLRNKALCISACIDKFYDLTLTQYIILERIGRSRRMGEITQGKISLAAMGDNPKSMFYHRKRLLKLNLITKQPHQQKGNKGQTYNGSLLHLTRFYVERRSKFIMMIQRAVEILKLKPGYCAPYTAVKEEMGMPETSCRKLFKSTEFQRYIKNVTAPYRKVYPDASPSQWRCKGKDAEKFVRIMELINPKIDPMEVCKAEEVAEEDEEDDSYPGILDQHRVVWGIGLLQQAYKVVEEAGPEGVSQSDMARLLGQTKLDSRTICRNLQRRNTVHSLMKDVGRQRVSRYVSHKFARTGHLTQEFRKERQRMMAMMEANKAEVCGPSTSKEGEVSRVLESNSLEGVEVGLEMLTGGRVSIPKSKGMNLDTSSLAKEAEQNQKKRQNNDDDGDSKNKGFVRMLEEIRLTYNNQRRNSPHVTTRMMKRANMIIETVGSIKVIDDAFKLQKMIVQAESEEGYAVKMDKKSLNRLLDKLSKGGFVKNIIVKLKCNTMVKVVQFVVHPSITFESPHLKSAIEQQKLKFLASAPDTKREAEGGGGGGSGSGKGGATGGPESTKVKVKSESSAAKMVKKALSEDNERMNKSSVGASMQELKQMHQVSTTAVPAPEVEAGVASAVVKKEAGVKGSLGPKFVRMCELHKLLFYLVYGYSGKEDMDQVEAWQTIASSSPEAQIHAEDLSAYPMVYYAELSWKMFIPPLPNHMNSESGWAFVCDVLLRLPLCIFVRLVSICHYSSEIDAFMNHPIKRNLLVKYLPPHLRQALLQGRRYVTYVIDLINRLCYVGLLQYGHQIMKEKDQVFIYVNRHASLIDTTTSGPGYHQISADKEYVRKEYYFSCLQDVLQYWYDMWTISMHTPLGGHNCMQGKKITIQILDRKPQIIESLTARSTEEAPARDNGSIPGDGRGAGGLDSAMFAHLKRNWSSNSGHSASARPSALLPPNTEGGERATYEGTISYTQYLMNTTHPSTDNTSAKPRLAGLRNVKLSVYKPRMGTDGKTLEIPVGMVPRAPRGRKRKREGASTSESETPPVKLKRSGRQGKSNRPASYQRELKMRKKSPKKPYYDEEDRAALRRMNKLRVDWSSAEDSFLLLCKVASCFLFPNIRSQMITFSLVRDMLHERFPESLNKTSRACQRRINYIMKNPTTEDNVAIFLEEVRQDPGIVADFKSPRVPRNKKNIESVYATMFRSLMQRLVVKFASSESRQCPDLPPSIEEFHQRFRIIMASSSLRNKLKFRPVVNVSDIDFHIVNTLIYSSLCSKHDRESYAYQLYLAYQQYPQALLNAVLTRMRQDQMISYKKCYNRSQVAQTCLPLSTSPFQLSVTYHHVFNFKYQYEIYSQAWQMLKQLITKKHKAIVDNVSYKQSLRESCLITEEETDITDSTADGPAQAPAPASHKAEKVIGSMDIGSGFQEKGVPVVILHEGGYCATIVALLATKRIIFDITIPEQIIMMDQQQRLMEDQHQSLLRRFSSHSQMAGKEVGDSLGGFDVAPSCSMEPRGDVTAGTKGTHIVKERLKEMAKLKAAAEEGTAAEPKAEGGKRKAVVKEEEQVKKARHEEGGNEEEEITTPCSPSLDQTNENSATVAVTEEQFAQPETTEENAQKLENTTAAEEMEESENPLQGTEDSNQLGDVSSLEGDDVDMSSTSQNKSQSSASRLGLYMMRDQLTLAEVDQINIQHAQEHLVVNACEITIRLRAPPDLQDEVDEAIARDDLEVVDNLLLPLPKSVTAEALEKRRRVTLEIWNTLEDVSNKWREEGESEDFVEFVKETFEYIHSCREVGASICALKERYGQQCPWPVSYILYRMEEARLVLRVGVALVRWVTMAYTKPWLIHTNKITRGNRQSVKLQGVYKMNLEDPGKEAEAARGVDGAREGGLEVEELDGGVAEVQNETNVAMEDMATEDAATEGVTPEDIATESVTTEDAVTEGVLPEVMATVDAATGVTPEGVATAEAVTEGVTPEGITTEAVTAEDAATEGVTAEAITEGMSTEDIAGGVTTEGMATGDVTEGMATEDIAEGVTTEGMTTEDITEGMTTGDIAESVTAEGMTTGDISESVTTEGDLETTVDETTHAQQDQDVTSSCLTEDFGESSVDLQDGTAIDSSPLETETGETFEDGNCSAISETPSTSTAATETATTAATTTEVIATATDATGATAAANTATEASTSVNGHVVTKSEPKASRRSQRISVKNEAGSQEASGEPSGTSVRHIHSCLAMRKRKYRKDEEASKEMERTIKQHHDTSDYEQISVAVRPWVRLNGTLNRRVLDRLLGAVLNLVMERPGISGRDIVCRFSPALQPAHTHDLLDTLVQIRCVVPLQLHRSHKPSLFADTVQYTLEPADLHDCEDEILYEPMVDAILKLAMFIGDKKYSQDFLSGDRR